MPRQCCSSCCSSSIAGLRRMAGVTSTLSLLIVLQCTLVVFAQPIYDGRVPNDAPQQPPKTIEAQLLEQDPHQELQHKATRPVIITAGDSITHFGYDHDGWVSLLQQQYPDVTFMNKGVHLGTTKAALTMLHWATTSPGSPLVRTPGRVKLITLCYGANDASTRSSDTAWRYVPLAEYKSNLMQTVQALRSKFPGLHVVLLTPPPAASPPRPDRRLEVTAEYAEAVRQVGKALKVPVVDLFHEVLAVPGWQTQVMLPDGLHLNPAGQQLLFGAVLPTVREAVQDA